MEVRRARRAVIAVAVVAAFLSVPAAAQALNEPLPEPPQTFPAMPDGYTVSPQHAFETARVAPAVTAHTREDGRLTTIMEAKPPDKWQVGFFSDGEEVVQVVVDSHSGAIKESWTGSQVAWQMARGYSGAFAHALNAPYVWFPLALIFFLGLFDFRRPKRIAHLDLLVLLSFGISNLFFTQGKIGISAPLYYPPLLYLLARMLWIGFKGRTGGLRPSARTSWLVLGIVFLIAFRVALNIVDSGVVDVGYAGVIGADRVTHGEPIYGDDTFPDDNGTGDTYGPANYYAYVPFEQALPWSGSWDELPSAHAAAIFFDLATVAGLFMMGLRLRPGERKAGRALGVMLAFAWCAYPYTDYALQSNSNDSLVSALLVWALVCIASPVRRGIFVGLAGAAKFTPLAVAPLLAVGERGLLDRLEGRGLRRPALRPVAYFSIALLAVLALMLLQPALDPGLGTFWDRTLKSQINRQSPFSIWGQVDGIDGVQKAVALSAIALAVLTAFVPRRRTPAQIAALGAAIVLLVEISLRHWFYLYIPWFVGFTFVALLAGTALGDAGGEGSAAGKDADSATTEAAPQPLASAAAPTG
jgi:hypothetical protein